MASSSAGCRDEPDLHHEAHHVEDPPALDDLAVAQPELVDAQYGEGLPARGDAEERAGVGAGRATEVRHAVALGHGLQVREVEVGRAVAETLHGVVQRLLALE